MKIKNLLIDFVTTFTLTLIATIIVTYLWNLVLHGQNAVDWETSFRFAIILGIALNYTSSQIQVELSITGSEELNHI